MHLRYLTLIVETRCSTTGATVSQNNILLGSQKSKQKKEPAVNGSGDPGWLRGGDVRSRALTRIRVAPSELNIAAMRLMSTNFSHPRLSLDKSSWLSS